MVNLITSLLLIFGVGFSSANMDHESNYQNEPNYLDNSVDDYITSIDDINRFLAQKQYFNLNEHIYDMNWINSIIPCDDFDINGLLRYNDPSNYRYCRVGLNFEGILPSPFTPSYELVGFYLKFGELASSEYGLEFGYSVLYSGDNQVHDDALIRSSRRNTQSNYSKVLYLVDSEFSNSFRTIDIREFELDINSEYCINFDGGSYPYYYFMYYLSEYALPNNFYSVNLNSIIFPSLFEGQYFDFFVPNSYFSGINTTSCHSWLYQGAFTCNGVYYSGIEGIWKKVSNPTYLNALGESQTLTGDFWYLKSLYLYHKYQAFTGDSLLVYDYNIDYFDFQNYTFNSFYSGNYYLIINGVFLNHGLTYGTLDENPPLPYGYDYINIFTKYYSPSSIYTGAYLPNVFGLMRLGFSGLFGLLQAQILPGITIGTFIFLPFFVLIVLAIIKLFKR